MATSPKAPGKNTSPPQDQRSEVRINEAVDKAVRAELIIEGNQRWKNLSITNLSQHGVSIDIPLLRAHLVYPKQKVTIKLRMGKEGVDVGGIVVHCHAPQIGIEFLEPEVRQWSYSDSVLSRMIFSLERKHLRKKAYYASLESGSKRS